MRVSKGYSNVAKGSHQSVTEMVRDLLADDPEFVKQFENRIAERELIKALMIARSRAGLTQEQLAEKMGCGQSKLSKLESGIDSDMRLGDILAYLKASGCRLKLSILPDEPDSRPLVLLQGTISDNESDPAKESTTGKRARSTKAQLAKAKASTK
jgi:transcriptional regulator with XRE-family HTH domain